MAHIDTELIHAGGSSPLGKAYPEALPIYPATAYAVEDMDDYDFANNGGKYFYNRCGNFNRDCLGDAISKLESGEKTMICASGMGAISTTFFGLLKGGDHILINRKIYSEIVAMTEFYFEKFGIEYSFADFTDIEAVKDAVRPNTKIMYTEVISNPHTNVVDLDSLSQISKPKEILLIVDSTFTSPIVIKPIEHGADIVIHSLTKFFGGHADVTGGSITGKAEVLDKIFIESMLLGACLDANSSWLISRSIKTLGMRVRTQCDNATAIAAALEADQRVRKVYHPSLPTHPQHELAKKEFDYGYGAIVSFEVENNRDKVNDFMHRLKILKYLGTLGGICTSYCHPRTAFKNEFPADELDKMGLSEGLIRISAGAEDTEELINDIKQALEAFN